MRGSMSLASPHADPRLRRAEQESARHQHHTERRRYSLRPRIGQDDQPQQEQAQPQTMSHPHPQSQQVRHEHAHGRARADGQRALAAASGIEAWSVEVDRYRRLSTTDGHGAVAISLGGEVLHRDGRQEGGASDDGVDQGGKRQHEDRQGHAASKARLADAQASTPVRNMAGDAEQRPRSTSSAAAAAGTQRVGGPSGQGRATDVAMAEAEVQPVAPVQDGDAATHSSPGPPSRHLSDQSTPATELASTSSPVPRRRTRQLLTTEQSMVLYKILEKTSFPSTQVREALARQLGISPRKVQVWFQNRRQVGKKMMRAANQGAAAHHPHQQHQQRHLQQHLHQHQQQHQHQHQHHHQTPSPFPAVTGQGLPAATHTVPSQPQLRTVQLQSHAYQQQKHHARPHLVRRPSGSSDRAPPPPRPTLVYATEFGQGPPEASSPSSSRLRPYVDESISPRSTVARLPLGEQRTTTLLLLRGGETSSGATSQGRGCDASSDHRGVGSLQPPPRLLTSSRAFVAGDRVVLPPLPSSSTSAAAAAAAAASHGPSRARPHHVSTTAIPAPSKRTRNEAEAPQLEAHRSRHPSPPLRAPSMEHARRGSIYAPPSSLLFHPPAAQQSRTSSVSTASIAGTGRERYASYPPRDRRGHSASSTFSPAQQQQEQLDTKPDSRATGGWCHRSGEETTFRRRRASEEGEQRSASDDRYACTPPRQRPRLATHHGETVRDGKLPSPRSLLLVQQQRPHHREATQGPSTLPTTTTFEDEGTRCAAPSRTIAPTSFGRHSREASHRSVLGCRTPLGAAPPHDGSTATRSPLEPVCVHRYRQDSIDDQAYEEQQRRRRRDPNQWSMTDLRLPPLQIPLSRQVAAAGGGAGGGGGSEWNEQVPPTSPSTRLGDATPRTPSDSATTTTTTALATPSTASSSVPALDDEQSASPDTRGDKRSGGPASLAFLMHH
ncbi:uncharacterized protein PSFLO_06575 [Pseudozyma flocculosa]|uniref:Homeobox domain-containing protein n=1 Tax=Pseudozyma flocculosa TaxID=84751 RepID=A0A5C3F9G4_9BASI|nr:uncharacterized protein PSFLO_06575 [Pseudozyma flocculosa]